MSACTTSSFLFLCVSFDQTRHAGSERRNEGGKKQAAGTAGQDAHLQFDFYTHRQRLTEKKTCCKVFQMIATMSFFCHTGRSTNVEDETLIDHILGSSVGTII